MRITQRRHGLKPRNQLFLFFVLTILWGASPAPASPTQEGPSPPGEIREERLIPIAEIVEEAIRAGKTPGAVVLVGNRGRIVYRRAFGHRALEPHKLPMTIDTIFDLSSLTKVIATAPAIMQLVEKGKIRLQAGFNLDNNETLSSQLLSPVCSYTGFMRSKSRTD